MAAVGSLLLLAACLFPGSTAAAEPLQTDVIESFLARHWQRPLEHQGPPPATFAGIETALDPASCGTCHPQQWNDWKTALHSHAMSPGLFGQLQQMGPDARDDQQACLECHAPLAEQQDNLQQTLAHPRLPPHPVSGASYADGLTCAGCHVRAHQRFGPARRDGSGPASDASIPHGGWQATSAFSDSRFCAACHQFKAGDPTLNGKLIENTYEEWRSSRYAREGRNCQACHMPDRRHLWRGIHDPATVKAGLAIESSPPIVDRGRVHLDLTITNVAVGHAFPTYVTPRVVVEIGQEDRRGRPLPGTAERHLIARDVSLDLTVERADTRLMPDEVRRYRYAQRLKAQTTAVVVRVRVEPDAFYADFYRATLRDRGLRKGRKAIEDALRRATASPYTLYEAHLPLTASSAAGQARPQRYAASAGH